MATACERRQGIKAHRFSTLSKFTQTYPFLSKVLEEYQYKGEAPEKRFTKPQMKFLLQIMLKVCDIICKILNSYVIWYDAIHTLNILCRHKDGAVFDFDSWRYPGPPYNFRTYKPDISTWQFDLKQEVFVEQHPLITRARPGDLIRVIRYLEHRHGIEVQDFQMTLLFKSPLTTDELFPPKEP